MTPLEKLSQANREAGLDYDNTALSDEQIDSLLSNFARDCLYGLSWRRTKTYKAIRAALAASDIIKAVRAEREACAKVCESLFDMEDDTCDEAEQCAAAIRSRGVK